MNPLNIISLSSVGSTNTYLKHLPPEEDEGWTLVTARYQEAGRGAGDNSWESEAGQNLLFSLRTHPVFVEATRVFALSEALSLSVWSTLQGYAPGFSIKWPNDIYHADRKVAGLLIENNLMGGRVQTSIMGVGLNVNQRRFLSDAPNPVSLSQILGHDVPCREVLGRFVAHLRSYYNMMQAGEYAALHTQFLEHLYRLGSEHAFRDADGTFRGRITGVEPAGRLVITDTLGRIRHYAFKEVEYIL